MRIYTLTFLLVSLLLLLNPVYSHQPSLPGSFVFIENKGQWANDALFATRIPNGTLYAESTALHFLFEEPEAVAKAFKHPTSFWSQFTPQTVSFHAVRMLFKQCNPNVIVTGEYASESYFNFFLGNNPAYWKSNVLAYSQIRYKQLYNQIDATYYTTKSGGLKYDFIIHPSGNPKQIQLEYNGQTKLQLKKGNLYVYTSINRWVEQKPYAYQIVNGVEVPVQCSFEKKPETNIITFKLGAYDTSQTLVIDPQLIFSTYSGSTVDNFGYTATYDNDGNLYAAGIARNPVFFPNGKYPVTPGAFQQVWGGGVAGWPQTGFPSDISISKYNSDGSKLLYATYLGGNRNDYPHSIVADKNGNLVVFGSTLSKNFPTTANAFDVTHNDSFDIIVTKLRADGTGLIGSTYIGGSGIDGVNTADTLLMNYADEFRGEIIIDQNNDILIATSTTSDNFPVTPGIVQAFKSGRQDGIICRLDSSLRNLKASTYFGRLNHDAIYAIDIASNGAIFISGGTQSNAQWFLPPTQSGSYNGGISDAFFAKLTPNLTAVSNFTFWGTNAYDQGYFIRIAPNGNPIALGQTHGRMLPKQARLHNDSASLFVTEFSVNLDSTVQSLNIGTKNLNNTLAPSAFMVDECGNIYGSVWGGIVNRQSRFAQLNPLVFESSTASLRFTPDGIQKNTDGSDFYLFVIQSDFDSLLYASFLGELGNPDHVDGGTSRFDKKGIIYQSICASCDIGTGGLFPTSAGSFSPTNQSPRCSNASVKLDFRKSNVVNAEFSFAPATFCLDSYVVVQYTNKSVNGKQHYWFVNNVLRDTTRNFADTIRAPGSYVIRLVEIDSSRCVIADTAIQRFAASLRSTASFTFFRDTCSPNIRVTSTSTPLNVPILWNFGDGDTSTARNVIRRYKDNGSYQILLITNPGSLCADSETVSIQYDSSSHIVNADITPKDTLTCEPTLYNYTNAGNRTTNLRWFVNNTLVDTNSIFDTTFLKGIYKVRLIARDNNSCNKADTSNLTVRVIPDAFPEFDFERDSCSFKVRFIDKTLLNPGDSILYLWRFGNGDSSLLRNPQIEYDTGGLYTVTLTTNPNLWCQTTTSRQIQIDTPKSVLNANFSISPIQSCSPSAITFVNQSVNDSSAIWLFNNVQVNNPANDTLIRNYTKDTIVTVKLIAINATTCLKRDTATQSFRVFNGTKSKFSFYQDTCTNRIFFKNEATAQNGIPLFYVWYFGDGQVSLDKNPFHIYKTNGTYNVSLVTNPGTFCSDSLVQQVVFDSTKFLLKASFTLPDTPWCVPANVRTTNRSFNGQINEWRLNRTLVSVAKDYSNTFLQPGTYRLQLLIRDNRTCTKADSTTKFFTVFPYGKTDFKIARDSCSLVVKFTNQTQSGNPNITLPIKWYFGDGDSSTETNPTHIYPGTDTYTIKLIASAGTPCADTTEKTFYIDGDTLTQVLIPNAFSPNNDGINDCYEVSGISPKCDQFEIEIYNRWGALYFKSDKSDACWNGKNEIGEDASAGVYYYILRYTKNKPVRIQKEERGTITLIRN